MNKKLLTVMLTAFFVVTVFSVFTLYRMALRETTNLLKTAISDVSGDIRKASDDNLLKLTRRIAEILETGDPDDLEYLKRFYDVCEINIIDQNGIITESTDPSVIGFDMHSGAQSSAFLVLLDGTQELVQPLGPISLDASIIRKYAAHTLSDGSFVQVGYDFEDFQDDIADEIQGITKNRHVLETGLVMILDENNSIVSLRGDLTGVNLRELLLTKTVDGETGVLRRITLAGERAYWMYDELEGYRIVAGVLVREALESVRTSGTLTAVTGILFFTLLFFVLSSLVKKNVVRPIDRVAQTLSCIADGDLEAKAAVKTTREFEMISDGINSTVDSLKAHIAREAARIDEELAYARKIQLSALPALSEQYTGRPDFRLYACMETAKEVGGDFYDFYMPDRQTLAFLVADVSGKGIPAAMFMMRGKAVLRDISVSAGNLGNAFSAANNRLCEGNEAGMFITSWMGLMDLETGLVRFANAGHNPPVLIRGGRARYLDMEADLILGLMDEADYASQNLQLRRNDILFLYTDGVTEAFNRNREFYGTERLLEVLEAAEENTCGSICQRVMDDVHQFADGAPQADDITMLCLHYTGI